MRRMALIVWAVIALPTITARVGGQASAPGSAKLTGTVLDTAQVPIGGVMVELLSLGQTRTDSAGVFRFAGVPRGSVILHVAKIGFQPLMRVISLAIADSIDLDVTLRPATYQLATVIVREDSNVTRLSDPTGFERRRKNGMGHYISADEIAQRQFSQTSQLLRSVPGISVNDRGVVTIQRGVNTLIGTSCESVVVFVDGIAIPAEKKAWNKETGFDVNAIAIAFIRGIEVYAGPATTPVELRSSRSTCGTVAIWTR